MAYAVVDYWVKSKSGRGTYVRDAVTLSDTFTPRIGYIFCNGQCHALAIALNEILGWPIFGEYDRFGCTGRNHRETTHFVVQTPSKTVPARNGFPARESCWMVDMHGMRCLDMGYRPTTAAAIRRSVTKDHRWLPIATDFARHYAPMVASELQKQFKAWKAGRTRPVWTLYIDYMAREIDGRWTAGSYKGNTTQWVAESTHATRAAADRRVYELSGGLVIPSPKALQRIAEAG